MSLAERTNKAAIWDRLATIDRRIIFLAIAVAVIVPFFFPIRQPLAITPPVQQVYDAVEAIKPGQTLMLVFDYDPASMPELNPMAFAILKQVFRKGVSVVACTPFIPAGAGMGQTVLERISDEMGKKQGEDWVNLGFKPGGVTVILGMNEDIHAVFPKDYGGRDVDDIPLMQKVHSYKDIPLIIDLSGTAAPETWIAFARVQCGVPVAAGMTAVMAPDFYPYLDAGKLTGLLGGLRGAAEYEQLTHSPGLGTSGMTSQSWAHAAIILFVIVGNIAFTARRRAAQRGGA